MPVSLFNIGKTIRQSIKWKMIVVLTIFMAGLVTLLSFVHLSSHQATLEASLRERIELMKENLVASGKTYAIALTHRIENEIAAYHFSGVKALIDESVQENDVLVHAALTKTNGKTLMTASSPDSPFSSGGELPKGGIAAGSSMHVRDFQIGGDTFVEVVSVIRVSTAPWGTLSLVYTEKRLNAAIDAARERNRKKIAETIKQSTLTAFGFILLCLLLVYGLSSRLSRPIVRLTRAAKQLSTGDFSASYVPGTKTPDEIGSLADAFAEMSFELKASYEKLEDINRTLEEKVRLRTAELNQRNIELDRANRTKGQFIANMSHEIRTPLNAIIGLTDILLASEVPARVSRHLVTVRSAAQSLLLMINDILDFSKIESGRLALVAECFRIESVIEQLIDLMAPSAFRKKLDFTVFVGDAVPDEVCGDVLRLTQILTNLTSNAIKFTENGSVHVAVERVDERAAGDVVLRFSVNDTGVGIEPDFLPVLFDSFVQADGSTTRKYGGTGLGLSISKQLIELMGGTIAVDSSPGVGSEFRFTARFEKSTATVDRRPPGIGAGKVALVVTTNRSTGRNARDLLAILGFQSRWISGNPSSAGGFEQGRDEGTIDVLLTDLALLTEPENRLAGFVRTVAEQSGAPIIMMAPQGSGELRNLSLEPGVSGIASLPLTKNRLRHAVRQALEARFNVDGDDVAPADPVSSPQPSHRDPDENLAEIIDTLWILLEENNLRARSYLEANNDYLTRQIGADTGKLIDLLLHFDFKGARRTLSELAAARGIRLGGPSL